MWLKSWGLPGNKAMTLSLRQSLAYSSVIIVSWSLPDFHTSLGTRLSWSLSEIYYPRFTCSTGGSSSTSRSSGRVVVECKIGRFMRIQCLQRWEWICWLMVEFLAFIVSLSANNGRFWKTLGWWRRGSMKHIALYLATCPTSCELVSFLLPWQQHVLTDVWKTLVRGLWGFLCLEDRP